SDNRDSSESSGDIGVRSQPNTRPRKNRRPNMAFAIRLGAAADSSLRMSATLRPAPPPGRSTTETSYKGTSRSTSWAGRFRRRYSAGDTRMRGLPRAQRGGHRQTGSADSRKKPARSADDERAGEALHDEAARDTKVEGDLREGVEVQRRERRAIAVDVGQRGAGRAAQQGEDERLEHHRGDDRRAAEADRSQRGDLRLATRDRGIHAVERAKRGADRHERRHAIAQDADQPRKDRGLFRVVLRLAQHVDGQPAIARDRFLEPGEAGGGRIGQR